MEPGPVRGYHAHVYFDAATAEAAASVREQVAKACRVRLNTWRDAPIGPHPCPSYEIAFAPEEFQAVVPWLMLHRQGLTVLIHPETGDDLADHTLHALWLGPPRTLKLDVLTR